MQRSKAISPVISRLSNPLLSFRRPLSTSPVNIAADDLDNQVLVGGIGNAHSRVAILNRPSVLNALNTTIGARLHQLYKSWEEEGNVGFVMLKGAGKAFCAGGDIVGLYHLINQGRKEDCKEFFRTLYNFIYFLGTYVKPHVALLNGVTMGGGAGISIPGTFRLATDKTVFATPETLIGFHPDAGASFYLPRLPGHLGEYLGLTGAQLSGAEMVACGLATHYSQLLKLPLIEEHLGKLDTDDPSIIETSLENFGEIPHLDQTSVMHRSEIVDKCFGHDTVEEIIDSLFWLVNDIERCKSYFYKEFHDKESESSSTKDLWCRSTLARLKETSPLSLKVSLRSIREGRYQTFDQCLEREYHMSLRGISKPVTTDFCEGVRARMVDKDMAPKWNPPSLDLVSKNKVEYYFAPIESESLHLPTKLREAFT